MEPGCDGSDVRAYLVDNGLEKALKSALKVVATAAGHLPVESQAVIIGQCLAKKKDELQSLLEKCAPEVAGEESVPESTFSTELLQRVGDAVARAFHSRSDDIKKAVSRQLRCAISRNICPSASRPQQTDDAVRPHSILPGALAPRQTSLGSNTCRG